MTREVQVTRLIESLSALINTANKIQFSSEDSLSVEQQAFHQQLRLALFNDEEDLYHLYSIISKQMMLTLAQNTVQPSYLSQPVDLNNDHSAHTIDPQLEDDIFSSSPNEDLAVRPLQVPRTILNLCAKTFLEIMDLVMASP
jgi:hypothetical protein